VPGCPSPSCRTGGVERPIPGRWKPQVRGGKTYKLDITGDDDVWVYINKQLAVDIGGTHTPVEGSITLDSAAATKFGLAAGNVCRGVSGRASVHVVHLRDYLEWLRARSQASATPTSTAFAVSPISVAVCLPAQPSSLRSRMSRGYLVPQQSACSSVGECCPGQDDSNPPG